MKLHLKLGSWAPWKPYLLWGCVGGRWAAWVFATVGLNKQYFSTVFSYFRVALCIFQIASAILHSAIYGFWAPWWPCSLSALAGRWSLFHACLWCGYSRKFPSCFLGLCTVIICLMNLLHSGEGLWGWGLIEPSTVRKKRPKLALLGLPFREGSPLQTAFSSWLHLLLHHPLLSAKYWWCWVLTPVEVPVEASCEGRGQEELTSGHQLTTSLNA